MNCIFHDQRQIADTFERIAELLEFDGANAFRIRAYRNGARTIRDHAEPLANVITDPNRKLTDISGIGKDLAQKCVTLIETGQLPMLNELLEKIPASVLAILRIPGLGPKKAATIHRELGITTLDELQAACEHEQVRALKGFAAKTEQIILAGIEKARVAEQRIMWSKADELVQELQAHLSSCSAIQQFEFAGSYRRGRETIGDLDILAIADDVGVAMDCLAAYSRVTDTIVRGETKMSINLDTGTQVDLRIVPAESFGAALQYFTGSKDHNVVVRGRARQMGLKVNEWGVYSLEDDTYVAGETEEDVYAALELPYFPPEIREARHEFQWAEAGDLPQLITLADICGDLHMHTNATDGKASIEEMAAAARALGLEYIAITDHSQRVSMANGLDGQRLIAQWKEVDAINATAEDEFLILKGIECDILEAGGMDLPDDVLSQADWVLASVHYGQQQSRQQITDRILGAIKNPFVSAIAHPTGRLINRRERYEVDMHAVMQAAQEHHTVLELNANPRRLDLDDVMCAAAKEMGIPIAINSDAHSPRGLGVLTHGIRQARRAGLTKADVWNTRAVADLLAARS